MYSHSTPIHERPEVVALRLAVRSAEETLTDALADFRASRRIGLERAKVIADKAVAAGIASWGVDQALQLGPDVRTRLRRAGARNLLDLSVADADALEASIAA